MLVAFDEQIVGVIGVADTVKPEAVYVIQKLKEMKIDVWMVTGDNKLTANAIASQLGIENVFAEVLPGNKSSFVEKVKSQGYIVAMVGDGINDSPALVINSPILLIFSGISRCWYCNWCRNRHCNRNRFCCLDEE